ncbi:rRNA maturation RNase YbeY [Methylocucumis oryzae]|uniref:Endoribonuclease YbeY n=1 Tax=Methylocucumis oryzae TaxID=1632867 RepID=A0A0F3IIA0_9GAMM|nr:rRNA maturation RNase YbeY [Methylocucumis oryzae]KJV05184.1 hypothetical protein VZ94_20070 [Methylocucumis oryzae]
MNYLDLQLAFDADNLPTEQQLQTWIDVALSECTYDTELVIRIVDENESASLNQHYRNKTGPTNVLSFPFEAPDLPDFASDLLGDLVICAPVIAEEALTQQKPLHHHWAHIVIHGVLHLLGYDHIDDDEAEIMEQKEIALLQQLNINNPYTGI